jgi:hypothetical protein
MARHDTAWFRVTVWFLAIVLLLALPFALLIWKTTTRNMAKQDAVIEQQNRKIAKLERKLNKDEE